MECGALHFVEHEVAGERRRFNRGIDEECVDMIKSMQSLRTESFVQPLTSRGENLLPKQWAPGHLGCETWRTA